MSSLQSEVKLIRDQTLVFGVKHEDHEKNINALFDMIRETQQQVANLSTSVQLMNQDLVNVKSNVQEIHDFLINKD